MARKYLIRAVQPTCGNAQIGAIVPPSRHSGRREAAIRNPDADTAIVSGFRVLRFAQPRNDYARCVSLNPASTMARPINCIRLGTSPSTSQPISSTNGGTSVGNTAARLAPSSTTERVNR